MSNSNTDQHVSAAPGFSDVLNYVRCNLNLHAFVPYQGQTKFDLVDRGPADAILTRSTYEVIGQVATLTTECRGVVFISCDSDMARRFIVCANDTTPFGSWHLDDDGELFLRCQTVLSGLDWCDQVHFLLHAPVHLAQLMQIELTDVSKRSDDLDPDHLGSGQNLDEGFVSLN